MHKYRISCSPLLRWILLNGLFFMVFMTAIRIVFFYKFSAPGISVTNFGGPFFLGFRYDLRVVCAIALLLFLSGSLKIRTTDRNTSAENNNYVNPLIVILVGASGLLIMFLTKIHPGLISFLGGILTIILISLIFIKNLNPFENKSARKIMKGWFILIAVIMALFTMADFEHYDYLRQRLSAGVFDYALDVKISLGMIWESYPISEIALYTAMGMIIVVLWLKFSFRYIDKRDSHPAKQKKLQAGIIFTVLLILGLLSKLYPEPLRWSDSFVFKDNFKTSLSLNPFQSFLSTVPPVDNKYDIKEVQKYYPQISEYLKVDKPDMLNLDFTRNFVPPPGTPKRNVVLVICESFSMYKSSMSGNKLNTTPYFNQLCREGIFFDRCFTPAYGTARGVWATLTGIPDVEYPSSSTRVPAAASQHSIINDYKGYKKFYFVGGDGEWANIGAFLRNNIDSLQLIDQRNFPVGKLNVWGIGDRQLMLSANDTLAKQKEPFVAIIQTSDNHRPYSIPSINSRDFKEISYPNDTLYKYGFSTNKELNAFRYTDYVFQQFMEAASREDYFKNTLFVFVGDHGIAGNVKATYPVSWEEGGLAEHHVPLLFYAPGFLQPKREDVICSQLDVLPTATTLAGVAFTNSTLGINLLRDEGAMRPAFPNVFLYDPTIQQIGVINDSLIYNYNLLEKKESDYPVSGDGDPAEMEEKSAAGWSMGWYQTAKYLLRHNKKSNS